MSRFHYWQFLINKEGQPIPDANISLYLAGTDSPAFIYFDEFGSNHTSAAPQVITNNMGYFEFWIGDASEEYGYQKGQKFKIEWEKPGVALGEIDWIDIFPHVAEVDETDQTSNAKNKVISNKLAYRWEEHKNSTLQDNGFPIHGIEAVNELDTDTFSNKLISNVLAKKWNDHSIHSFGLTSDTPHGLLPVDGDNDDNYFDKLVSNKIIHDIYQDITVINNTLDDIGDGGGNAGNIFLEFQLSSEWVIYHNFGVKYVSVTCFDDADMEVRPISIELNDQNSCTVTFESNVKGYAVVTGNVVFGGPETPPFEITGDHGSLTGLLSDDHPQYILEGGSRPFIGPISGITPVYPSHLTTKEYVDNEIDTILLDHSRISNSALGDDHIQYVHLDGRRGFQNPIKGENPIEDSHLATKSYVDFQTIESHGDLINMDMDDHEQYVHIDGRRAFTHNISGVIPIAPDHLTTKEYVDAHGTNKYDETVVSWDTEGANFAKTITHNLDEEYPIVTMWNITSKEMVKASEIMYVESLNNTTLKIVLTIDSDVLVKVRT